MLVYHYSAKPLKHFNRERHFRQLEVGQMKPPGFWVTSNDDDNWENWCRAEEYNVLGLRWRSTFSMDGDSVKVIRDLNELLDFSEEFSYRMYLGGEYSDVRLINWLAVMQRWMGLYIDPHQVTVRLSPEFLWYSVWDCASGCVWDLSALTLMGCEECVA